MPEQIRKEALKERREWLNAFYSKEGDVECDLYGEYILSKFEDRQVRVVRIPWHLNLSTINSGRKPVTDRIDCPINLVEA